jgi:hypothetical protein
LRDPFAGGIAARRVNAPLPFPLSQLHGTKYAVSFVYKVFCTVGWSWAAVVVLMTLWLRRQRPLPSQERLVLRQSKQLTTWSPDEPQ